MNSRTITIISFLLVFVSGCATYTPPPPPPQPPPESIQFDKTMYMVITSVPSGADVLTVKSTSNSWESGEKIGTTPFSVPVKFVEWDGAIWFKDSVFSSNRPWSPIIEGRGHRVRFYIRKEGYYGVIVNTHLYFADRFGHNLNVVEGDGTLTDGYRITLYKCPVELIPHGREFAKKFARAIEKDDYYGAEELRLRRIQLLKNRIKENGEFWDNWSNGDGTQTGGVTSKLIASELEQLEHTVGLLDTQLMSLRKQLVKSLHAGDIEAAFALAQAVAVMEARYFPAPQKIVAQVPQVNPGTQQSKSPQRVVVQQKPYYGATHLVQALAAMRGSKVSPEAYQRALGGAQLLDVLGFSDLLNK